MIQRKSSFLADYTAEEQYLISNFADHIVTRIKDAKSKYVKKGWLTQSQKRKALSC